MKKSIKRAMRRVFIEYKAMELFYTQLSLLDSQTAENRTVGEAEHKAVSQAHALLLEDMADPPSLHGLAREVGLGQTRLKKLFRVVYGDTVFGVLRKERLDCARRLLEEGRQSVSEIAYECGFSSPSHLTRSFSRQYGMQPKRCQTSFLHVADNVQGERPAKFASRMLPIFPV